MKISTEQLEKRQLRLTVEVEPDLLEEGRKRAAQHIAKGTSIPGFRKGKAPYDVVLRRYGQKVIDDEAAEILADEVLPDVIEELDVDLYKRPELESVTLDPLTYTVLLTLPPVVELGDYRSIRMESEQVEVEQQEIDQALEQLRNSYAILEPIEDQPAEPGNRVTADVTGIVDGETVLKEEGAQFILDPEVPLPGPGFHEALVGMNVGDERTFDLTIPEDSENEDLRGQMVTFHVTLKALESRTLPALDDDLARTVGGFDSFEALRSSLVDDLRAHKTQDAERNFRNQVVQAVVDQAQVDFPAAMEDRMLDSVVQEFEERLRGQSRVSLADYYRITGETEEELRAKLRPQAFTRLTRGLVLNKVVEEEQIEVTEAELQARINLLSQQWGAQADRVREMLMQASQQDTTRDNLAIEKAISRLAALARGEGPEPSVSGGTESEPGDEDEALAAPAVDEPDAGEV